MLDVGQGLSVVALTASRVLVYDAGPSYALPPQPIDATQALNLSAGVSNSDVLRGRSFS